MNALIDSGLGGLHDASVGARLGKVEDKLDNITVALTSLVRIEERQIAMADRLTDGAVDLKKHEARIAEVEAAVHRSTGARDVIIWVVGLVQVLGLGLGGYFMSHINTVNERLGKIDLNQATHRANPNAHEVKK